MLKLWCIIKPCVVQNTKALDKLENVDNSMKAIWIRRDNLLGQNLELGVGNMKNYYWICESQDTKLPLSCHLLWNDLPTWPQNSILHKYQAKICHTIDRGFKSSFLSQYGSPEESSICPPFVFSFSYLHSHTTMVFEMMKFLNYTHSWSLHRHCFTQKHQQTHAYKIQT
mgnify:CR=1 FL=1